MSRINKKILSSIGVSLISAPASAGLISFNETATLDELLNAQNPQLQGAFDLSSVLAQVSQNNETITGVDAMISAYGHSDAENNQQTTDYSTYDETSSVNRDTSYSYNYSYSCGSGWSSRTCYATQYVNRTATDKDFDREVIAIIEDEIADEMLFAVAGNTYSDTVELFENTVDGDRKKTNQTGSYAYGYTNYFDNTSTEYSQFFGDLALNIDLSSVLIDELDANNWELNWAVDANTGQFNIYDVALSVTFTTEKNLVNVPEPAPIVLLGLGLAGLRLSRRYKKNKSD